jgi:arylsulfatase A-like enzyme
MTSSRGAARKPNILLIAVDSLRADHMSCYGYSRLTSPHVDRVAQQATLFENTFSPHIPTTSAYTSMLTGMDAFNTQVVALRHKGGVRSEVTMLPEILRDQGYNTTCVGHTKNPSARGFDTYLDYRAWGTWADRPLDKAQDLNRAVIPELDRLLDEGSPFFVLLRHMEPHAPYLPPEPYERMFYHGDECDPNNDSMKLVFSFKPFRDFFASWMPPGITDKDYVIAQYDGAIAYMDACIQTILTYLEAQGVLDDTIVVFNSDHGETLYAKNECWFDHHGLYDSNLHVPLIIRYPARMPAGARISGYNQLKDLVPTLLELAGIESDIPFDGKSLMGMVRGEVVSHESELYLTECTWMRKHGWRTPEWKLIRALEPDFHFKPPVELYNLNRDPDEDHNLAEAQPEVVDALTRRMEEWIALRERETGLGNPIFDQGDWHGHEGVGVFKSSQQAYDTLHIGDPTEASSLQAGSDSAADEIPEGEGGSQ